MVTKFTPFGDLKATTMTLVAPLTGEVDLVAAYCALHINIPSEKRSYPGMIYSIRCVDDGRQCSRGVPTASKAFKNCVSISMTTSGRPISAKLSKTKIQLAGGQSLEHGEEACQLLLEALREAERERLYALDHPEENKAVLDWFEENIREEEGGLSVPRFEDIQDLDPYLFNRYLYLLGEAADKKFLMEEMRWLSDECPQIISEDCEVRKVTTSMVNYNFNLNFSLDRKKIEEAADSQGKIGEFLVSLDNTTQPHTRFSLPIDKACLGNDYKVSKDPHHTFIVYHSGKVMHSAPLVSLMEEAYNKLWNLALSFKNDG